MMINKNGIKRKYNKVTKHLSITVSDYTFNQYLAQIKNNRSAFIEEMIIKGVEQSINSYEDTRAKVVTLIQQLNDKDQEIKKLKFQIEGLRVRTNRKLQTEMKAFNASSVEELEQKKEELHAKEQYHRSLKIAGVLNK